jgi:DNA modification methylase
MSPRPRKPRTKTSPFGSPSRVSHDSAPFYASRLYEGVPRGANAPGVDGEQVEQPLPEQVHNQVLCKSSEVMDELPDNCIHLMVTSPPYNASKDYDDDLNLEEYLEMLRRVWQETYRVLIPGGRACINVANLGRKPYIPLHSYLVGQMEALGFLMRGEVIWNKAASAGASTAWGSWRSPANPVLRDVHEYILVFSKGTFSRKGTGKHSTIGRDEFLEWTKSVWTFPPASAKKVGHPAPFPEELPHRLIQLYTFEGEVVLDPFAGSGTTCQAALADRRAFVGYELQLEYVELTRRRLAEYQARQAEGK